MLWQQDCSLHESMKECLIIMVTMIQKNMAGGGERGAKIMIIINLHGV